MLAKHLVNSQPWRLDKCLGKAFRLVRHAFPNAASGTRDAPDAEVSAGAEPWRKCKGG